MKMRDIRRHMARKCPAAGGKWGRAALAGICREGHLAAGERQKVRCSSQVNGGTDAWPQAEDGPARHLQAPGGAAERRAAGGAMARTGRNAQGRTEEKMCIRDRVFLRRVAGGKLQKRKVQNVFHSSSCAPGGALFLCGKAAVGADGGRRQKAFISCIKRFSIPAPGRAGCRQRAAWGEKPSPKQRPLVCRLRSK